jgi:hypothetical protein
MSAAPQIRTALLANLKELHLPAMRGGFEQAAQRAEKETLSYEQYPLELSERECEAQRGNRIAKLLRVEAAAGEELANFDLKRLPAKVGRQLKVLRLNPRRCSKKEQHLFIGCAGVHAVGSCIDSRVAIDTPSDGHCYQPQAGSKFGATVDALDVCLQLLVGESVKFIQIAALSRLGEYPKRNLALAAIRYRLFENAC